jgi:ESCRT-I complex subunit VPS28
MEFSGKQHVKNWLSKLHNLPAYHTLSEDEVRQLAHELETAYQQFVSKINEQ